MFQKTCNMLINNGQDDRQPIMFLVIVDPM